MPRKAKKTTQKKTARKATAARKPAKQRAAKGAASRQTAKKAVTMKAAKRVAPKAAKKIAISNLKQPYTKSQMMGYLAESTELTKKDISNLFEGLGHLMEQHLKSRTGPGEFIIPSLLKCVVKHKPATKARKGTNPFTGEPMTFKAKPARNIVKIRPLKKLKEMAK